MFEKYDSSNIQQKWMVAPFSKFYGKICAGFCLNDTHTEKLFYSIQYKNGWLAASDLFHVYTTN